MFLAELVTFFLISTCDALHLTNNVVVTKQGSIRGEVHKNGEYTMYSGVPYALVNETMPFGKSLPPPVFDGIFDANNDTIACPQYEYGRIYGTLQCLVLNVYVPRTPTKKPVMVWLHGGKLTFGNANKELHDPTFLMAHDIILVTVNYRLGPYGFMCLDIPEIPGNQGLKDQLTALRWVKDNIKAFGGDDENVTFIGESAGAMSVDLHLFTKPEENLYNKVILQSGQAFSPVLFQDKDTQVPFKIARKMSYESSNLDEVLHFLANADVLDVVRVAEELQLNRTPCVEKEFENVESFLTDYPGSIKPGKIKSMPIMVGYNNLEMLFEYVNKNEDFFKNYKIGDIIKSDFDFCDELDEIAQLIWNFYCADDEGEEVKMGIINFASDYWFSYPTERAVRHYIDRDAKVYQYIFTYEGKRNFVKVRGNITHEGAAHADELGYMFDMALFKDKPNAEDQLMIDRITTMWTNFAKYGNPTPQKTSLLPFEWPSLSKSSKLYLEVDSKPTLLKRPFHSRMAFWDLFYKMYGGKLRRLSRSSIRPTV